MKICSEKSAGSVKEERTTNTAEERSIDEQQSDFLNFDRDINRWAAVASIINL